MSWTGAPIALVKAKGHCFSLCSAFSVMGVWRVEKGLVVVHANEALCASCEFCEGDERRRRN